ncbi:trans-hexaprenyltranstransferase [Coprinopsis sp. MPI-PUGE-AT-0042]|nr:trans-hexaprenyltranstransferase [Coprinopsis sp. MPI-PUGE-AT-0042]
MQGIGRSLRASTSTLSRAVPKCPLTRHKRRKLSALAQKTAATTSAPPDPAWSQKVEGLSYGSEHAPIPPPPQQLLRPDPFRLVSPELNVLQSNLLGLLGSAHPGLAEIAKFYFLHPSKQLRSLLVLLFARATNGLGRDWQLRHWEAGMEAHGGRGEELDRPLRSSETLSDCNPNMPDHTESFAMPFELRRPSGSSTKSIPPLPIRTSAISMFSFTSAVAPHPNAPRTDCGSQPCDSETASNYPFGNKLSILGGDFLLGRASTVLSHLGGGEVVELISSVISNLVEGEFLRMEDVRTPALGLMEGPKTAEEGWKLYMSKTYFKTASLMAKGARASVVLGGAGEGELWKEIAYAYGRNLGIAHQLVEDAMEYDGCSPSLQPGLATGPALYALEEQPDLKPLMSRHFSQPGDTDLATQLVQQSSGVERTRLLALSYAEKAREALARLPESDTKLSLEALTETVVNRTW